MGSPLYGHPIGKVKYNFGDTFMWYFSWILGTGLACSFAILNAMWFELDVHKHEGQ